jgi:hypothetical protein
MGIAPTRPPLAMAVYLQAVDGDIDAVSVMNRDDIDVGRNPIPNAHAMRSGRRVLTDNLPTKVRKVNGHGRLDDVEVSHHGQIVTDRFKDVVDDVCGADAHQFEPVEVTNAKKHENRHRWWFVPSVRLFPLDPQRTQPPLHELGFYPKIGAPPAWQIVFRREVVQGHSLFCAGELLLEPVILVDDDFVSACDRAGIKGLTFRSSFPVA